MEFVLVNHRASWLMLLSLLGCAPLPRQSGTKPADVEALAALRNGMGAQAERLGSFPSYMHVVDGFVVLYRRPPLGTPGYQPPSTRTEIAAAIWNDSANVEDLGRSVGARITPLSGSCDQASWARVAGGKLPRVYPAQEPSPAWQRAVRAQFRKLLDDPPWCAELGRQKSAEHLNSCEHLKDSKLDYWEPAVRFFPSVPAYGALVTASVRYGHPECLPWDYHLCEVWAVRGTPAQAEQAQFRHLDGVTCGVDGIPEAVITFGDDRQLTFLVPEGLHVPAQAKDAKWPLQTDFLFLPKSFSGDGCAPPTSLPAHQRDF